MLRTDLLPLIHAAIALPWRYPRIPDVLSEDMTFADLGLGPVDVVCIAMACEEHLGREISDAEAARWDCVGDVVASCGQVQEAR